MPKTRTLNTQRLMMAVLLGALSVDWAVRLADGGMEINKADLASVADDKTCATTMSNALLGKSANGCKFTDNVKKAETTAFFKLEEREVRSGGAAASSSGRITLDLPPSTPPATPPTTGTTTPAARAAVKKKYIVVTLETSATENEAFNTGTEEHTFEATAGMDLEAIAKRVRELAAQQVQKLVKKSQDEKRAEAAAAALKRDQENCTKGEDGKALSSTTQMDCLELKLSSSEKKDVNAAFSKITANVRRMVESGTDEQREEAIALLGRLKSNGSLSRDQLAVSEVMSVGANYQKQVLAISKSLSSLPANSGARAFHLQRLAQLNNQMSTKLNTMYATAQQRSMARGGDSRELMELENWMGTLTDSMATALSDPRDLLDRSGFSGRNRLGFDINNSNRSAFGSDRRTYSGSVNYSFLDDALADITRDRRIIDDRYSRDYDRDRYDSRSRNPRFVGSRASTLDDRYAARRTSAGRRPIDDRYYEDDRYYSDPAFSQPGLRSNGAGARRAAGRSAY